MICMQRVTQITNPDNTTKSYTYKGPDKIAETDEEQQHDELRIRQRPPDDSQ